LDFGIYGYSQAELSKALFHDSITMGWIAFGLGYSVRPVGAHVLGKFADRTSRTISFSMAILGMAGATAGLALLPAVCEENSGHNTGWWTHHYCVSTVYLSAIPAILLRCVQGFSAGAAAGGVNVIQSENASSSPSQSVGVNNVSGAAASMLSAGLVYGLRALLGEEAYAVWGWRLAFGLVIPPSLLAACVLSSDAHDMHGGARLLSPANEYELTVVGQQFDRVDNYGGFQDEATLCQDDEPALRSPFSVASQHDGMDDETSSSVMAPRALAPLMVSMWSLMIVSVFIQFAIASYNNLNIYLVQYATTELGFDVETATLLAVVGKAVQLLLTPFAAALADFYGWFTVCGISGVACAFVAIPIMSTRHPSLFQIWWLVAGVLPLVSTPWIMNAPLMATSIFPRDCRSQRTSLVMALGTALAGFFPLVLHQIETTTSTGNSGGDYRSGVILAMIAGMAATAIFWIRRHARQGRIIIYQRPELV
jgi:hypothetical protein